MASNRQEIQQFLDTGTYNVTVPAGFSSNVVVYAWGAGGGVGHVRGGAGGFVKSIVQISSGDSLVVSVGGPGGNDPGSESRPYTTSGITGRRNIMSGGEGYFNTGNTSTTYSATVTDNPGSQANGYYVATPTATNIPNTNAIQYIVRKDGKTIWEDTKPPPGEFVPGTYQGSSAAIGVNPGWPAIWHPWPTFNWNAFDLVNTPNLNFNGGEGAPQSDPEDGDAGPSGGGGAASAVIVNGIVRVVAAGGGGGGGYGEDGAGGATPGLPGGRWVPTASSIYPVTLSRAWNAFMNNYAVWGGGQDYTTTINFPASGTYTFNFSVDNVGKVYLDGVEIISYSDYTTTTTYTQVVSSGNHTVRVTGINTGGPAGVAAQILKPDGSELWNTRYLILTSGLSSSSKGANGTTRGGGGSGGGGAGYPLGGDAGTSFGDDQRGAEGGNGGQNYNGGYLTAVIGGELVESIVEAGSEAGTPGGLTDEYYPGGKRGYPGTSGAVVLVFIREFTGWIKENDDWKQITDAYVLTPDRYIEITRPGETKTITYSSGTNTFVVPERVTAINVIAVGGGGGGGGTDSAAGAVGRPGAKISGSIPVSPGQTLLLYAGSGGGGGANDAGSAPGGAGGTSNLGYNGGSGSAAGPVPISGGGGGGGAASVVFLNGSVYAVAAGGGGGGGGGNGVPGQGVSPGGTSGSISGSNGQPKGGDGGGAGGGGGGHPQGGAGGTVNGGDVGGNSGADGQSLVPAGFTLSSASNGGTNGVRGVRSSSRGGSGSISITYVQAGETVLVNAGGWKRIIRGWIKDANEWKNISAGGDLISERTSSTPGGVLSGPTINISLYSEVLNYNLYGDALTKGYVAGRSTINLTLDANVVVGSDSPTQPALLVTGFASGDRINITNYGIIAGAGGQGGTGSQNGQDGGIGLRTDNIITIDNRGTIQGGGGGGAGVVRYGLATATSKHPTATYAGGGGAGLRAGTSGSPGRDTEGISTGSALAGNLVVGGTGTFGNNSGGNPGAAGNVYAEYGSSLGGAAGAAVYGNTYVTWSNVGTIKGSRV